MLMRAALACSLLFLATGFVIADDPAAAPADNAQPGADAGGIDDLFGGEDGAVGEKGAGDDGLARDIVTKMTQIQESMEEMKKLNEMVIGNMTQIGDLKRRLDTQSADLKTLSENIEELKNQVADQNTRQGQILDTIQDSSGNTILPLTAIMNKSPDFAKEMTDAVHSVIKQEGLLSIENKTSTFRRIHVNRTEFGVKPNDTLTLKVPTGTVSTQIDGEELKTWAIGAPSYSQKIEIIPTTTRTTALRPTTPQTTTAYYPATTPVTTAYYPSTPMTTTYSVPVTTPVYRVPTTTYRYPVYYYYRY